MIENLSRSPVRVLFVDLSLFDLSDIHENNSLTSLNGNNSLSLAGGTIELEGDLLSSLGLLSEDRLGLTTKT